jgi:thiamine biosynthesis lipoprotein ApbE
MSKTLKTLWQLFHKAHGQVEEPAPPPEPREQQESVAKVRKDLTRYSKITIRLPTHIVKTYKHLAIDLQTTMQDLMAIALAYYLEKELKIGGNQNAGERQTA